MYIRKWLKTPLNIRVYSGTVIFGDPKSSVDRYSYHLHAKSTFHHGMRDKSQAHGTDRYEASSCSLLSSHGCSTVLEESISGATVLPTWVAIT